VTDSDHLELPILEIEREDGEQALLDHHLTDDERHLFTLMDSSTIQIPEDSELEAFHAIVGQIGVDYGLTRAQGIALWTRVTFGLFET
jgi:hypothetical protein